MSGNYRRVSAFCRQIHTQYAQKISISHRVQIPVTKDRNEIPSLWGVWRFILFVCFLFYLFDLVVCFMLKLWNKCRARVYILLENHLWWFFRKPMVQYQNWILHCQMSFCKHVITLVLSRQYFTIRCTRCKRSLDGIQWLAHDLCW